jgi:hypothetical protein
MERHRNLQEVTMAIRYIDPPELVEVQRDRQWYPGELVAWRKQGGVWLACVRYTTSPEMRGEDWAPSWDVRPRGEP